MLSKEEKALYAKQWRSQNLEKSRAISKRGNKKYRAAYHEKILLKERERREQRTAQEREWRKNNRDKVRSYCQKWQLLHKFDRRPAQTAIYRAVRDGKIIRPNSCSQCLKSCKPEAHHYKGYGKEFHLDVIWLCRLCHGAELRLF